MRIKERCKYQRRFLFAVLVEYITKVEYLIFIVGSRTFSPSYAWVIDAGQLYDEYTRTNRPLHFLTLLRVSHHWL